MSKNKLSWIFIFGILLVFLTGCACDDTGHNEFVVIPDVPVDESIISSLIPDFAWHDDSSCTPDNFLISMNGVGNSYYEYALVPGNQSSYTWHEFLDPGNQYKYRMRVNADNGPTSPHSNYLTFYTGPVCSGETLIAPELISPGSTWNGGWITHDHLQEFRWSYPGSCLPSYYDYEFATDAAFTNVIDSGTTPDHQMFVEKTFPNCSTIFWRVRANHGGSVGPWSDPFDFHWVREGTECYQTHYLSDDAARISVWLYHDNCSHTGDAAGMRLSSSGCKLDKNGVTLVGDGERTFPPDSHMWDYEVDLGNGPCPSTGLDHKDSGGLFIFNVLAPGTYCVSMTRNQIVKSGAINLMDGIWTDPRVTGDVAYKTIELGPGTSDVDVYFGWDEYDHFIVMPRLPETKNCRICPDPIGPVVEILMEESFVELFGRDRNSAWKLTYAQGVPCYLWLLDEKINQALMDYEGFDWRAEDLEFFPQPDPCPKPEPKPGPDPSPESQPKTCSDYATRTECGAHSADGCKWNGTTESCDGP